MKSVWIVISINTSLDVKNWKDASWQIDEFSAQAWIYRTFEGAEKCLARCDQLQRNMIVKAKVKSLTHPKKGSK